MGREVKRVPLDFEWPMYTIWWGYLLKEVRCQTCRRSRESFLPRQVGFRYQSGTRDIHPTDSCSTCAGAGKVRPRVEVPTGPGYQLWETITRGSPVSPVFSTPRGLARWIMRNEAEAAGDMPFSYQDWLQFIINTSDQGWF